MTPTVTQSVQMALVAVGVCNAGIACYLLFYGSRRERKGTIERQIALRTKEAERLRKRERDMFYDISHGLRTPLAVVKGELSALKQREPNNKKLLVFERSLDDVSVFINNLLSLARLDAQSKALQQTPVNISTLCEELAECIEVVASAKHIRVIHSLEKQLVVCGSREHIAECVRNIASNAVLYKKPTGTHTVTITLKRRREWAVLVIADTGMGIPVGELPHIFERFHRASQSAERTRGSGLGLPIAKKIVEQHGGTIGIESTRNEGTVVTVAFPLLRKKSKRGRERFSNTP